MIHLINIAKKVCFSRKLKKKTIFDFFFHLQSREGSYQSSGNIIFEYLMMYQFDFIDIIITVLYHIFLRYFVFKWCTIDGSYK